MDEAIKNFGKQFDYVPEIINKENLHLKKHLILLGMGGSHLAGGLAKNISPLLDLWIHRDYGLPEVSSEFLNDSLVIGSSYSGNTEEVIDGIKTALSKGLSCAVISVGGRLIEIAKENNLPYIQILDTGIQPRSALGYSLVALAHLLQDFTLLQETGSLKGKLEPEKFEVEGKKLAEDLKGKVPIIYASRKNFAIAYNWKIKFNETGKIPAFFNLLPELNHNEMTGFDLNEKSKSLGEKFKVIFLKDATDHLQIQKRMDVTKKLYEDRGIETITLDLKGSTIGDKVFNSLLLADWTAFHTASMNGAEAEQVPMVEEFKKLISA